MTNPTEIAALLEQFQGCVGEGHVIRVLQWPKFDWRGEPGSDRHNSFLEAECIIRDAAVQALAISRDLAEDAKVAIRAADTLALMKLTIELVEA